MSTEQTRLNQSPLPQRNRTPSPVRSEMVSVQPKTPESSKQEPKCPPTPLSRSSRSRNRFLDKDMNVPARRHGMIWEPASLSEDPEGYRYTEIFRTLNVGSSVAPAGITLLSTSTPAGTSKKRQIDDTEITEEFARLRVGPDPSCAVPNTKRPRRSTPSQLEASLERSAQEALINRQREQRLAYERSLEREVEVIRDTINSKGLQIKQMQDSARSILSKVKTKEQMDAVREVLARNGNRLCQIALEINSLEMYREDAELRLMQYRR